MRGFFQLFAQPAQAGIIGAGRMKLHHLIHRGKIDRAIGHSQ
jgi:hypothetical protein